MSSRKLNVEPEIAAVRDLSHDGEGICAVNGKVAFVPGALPGETIRLKRVLRKRQHDIAELVEVIEPSADRVAPACSHFGVCGGCSLQHMHPAAQLRQKERWLMDNLHRIAGLRPQTVLPPLTGPVVGYRRRARLGLKYVFKKERLLIGFRERNGRYLADLERCPVLDERVGTRLLALRDLVASLSCAQQIPQIEIATGTNSVACVIRHLQPLTPTDEEILRGFARSQNVHVFLQPGGPDSVRLLWPEQSELSYRLEPWNVTLHFDPADFVQVNPDINEKMIGRALDLLALTDTDRVLDLFCGLGNFTLPLARVAQSVVGVEGDAGLVHKAERNASANDVHNATFYTANLAQPPDPQLQWVRAKYDKILLDPPRTGAVELVPYLGRSGVTKIVYVSCNPSTLARDAGELVKFGYRLSSAGVMDMFPHTTHIESIALFEKA